MPATAAAEQDTEQATTRFAKDQLKAIIERIVAEEDKEKPLSDQKIATMLEDKGFQIARRTVTKYRATHESPGATP